jgi:hypothetical protein
LGPTDPAVSRFQPLMNAAGQGPAPQVPGERGPGVENS